MELLKGSVENDMFDAIQHVFYKDLQNIKPTFSRVGMKREMSELMDSLRVKDPGISSETVKLILEELGEQEERGIEKHRPKESFNHGRLLTPPIMRNLNFDDRRISEIREEFDKRLKVKKLAIEYDFSIGAPNPRFIPGSHSDAVFHEDGMQLRPFMISPEQNKFIIVKLKHSWKFFMYSMSWQLIVSLFILVSMMGSFVYLFLTIFRQNKLNVIRKSLMHSMSHELRTPVTTARVALEAMEDFVAPDDHALRRRYNEMAREDLDHLSTMLDRVLDIVNLDGKNHNPLDLSPIDVRSFLTGHIEHFKLLHRIDVMEIELESEDQEFVIMADKLHLKNVFNNLLENSIKYGANKIKIEIKKGSFSKNVEIIFHDNGIGIPSEYHSEVFETFFRVPRGDLYEVKGFGLGLSYVKQIVNRHKGVVKIKSEVGEGSSFILSFPTN